MLNSQAKLKGQSKITAQRIQEAALRLFAQKGFQATSIRDLALETGLNSATLYYYMGTKEDLLIQIMSDAIELLLNAAKNIVGEVEEIEEQLASLVYLHVWVHATHPLSTRIAHNEIRSLDGEMRSNILKLRDQYEAIWRGVVKRGNLSGKFKLEDPKLATIAIMEMCSSIQHWYRTDGEHSLTDICCMHIDWVLIMVQAERSNQQLRASHLQLKEPQTYIKQTEK